MHIEKITLRNFRCFGDNATSISLAPGINGFVGDNGSGKSSALEALKRLFSPNPEECRLRKSDIHFGPKEDSQTVSEREVFIDVVFGFDEGFDVPTVFNDVFFDASGEALKVRVRLEALYVSNEAFEDEIEVKTYTIRTLDEVPFGPDDERKVPFRGRPRQFAELFYIPAHRDSLGVTKHALKNVLKRIERSAAWDDITKSQSKNFAQQLEDNLNGVVAIQKVTEDLKGYWGALHDGHYDADPLISVVATEFEKLIRDLTLRFQKSPGGGQRQLDELSEGQVSLLYFALSATLHGLERKMERASPKALEGFKAIDFTPAPLTIFALEEPENHLAPFYLPRLMSLLSKLYEDGSAQSIVTSHSTSILTRIPPRRVRYFRNCRSKLTSTVKNIPLPEEGTEEDKFLSQVILANPEIYFARLIIVGEGDSERIVIPRIAEAFDIPLDPSFVAFVPVGGRHAQHLWTLASGLGIPHLTLLDLDLGRYSAGMGRVKNGAQWLKDIGVPIEPSDVISNEELTPETFQGWVNWLRSNEVYYSSPLDLDMMMISHFPSAYAPSKAFDPSKVKMTDVAKSVFGDNGKGNAELKIVNKEFTDEQLYVYKNLFKSKSKPASHLRALATLEDKEILAGCPEPLKALVQRAKALLKPEIADEPDRNFFDDGEVMEQSE